MLVDVQDADEDEDEDVDVSRCFGVYIFSTVDDGVSTKRRVDLFENKKRRTKSFFLKILMWWVLVNYFLLGCVKCSGRVHFFNSNNICTSWSNL